MKKQATIWLLTLLPALTGCLDLSTVHESAATEPVDTTPLGGIVEHTAQGQGEDPLECVDPVPDDFWDPCQSVNIEPVPCPDGTTNPWAWVPPTFDADAPLELSWFRSGETSTGKMNPAPHGGGSLSFSPNGGLLELSSPLEVGGPTHIFTRDGESGFVGPKAGDLSWTTRLESEVGGDVVLRAHIPGHEIHRFSPESPDGNEDWEVLTYGAALTPWGEGAVTLHCFVRDGESVLEAHSWSAWSGQLVAKSDLSFLGFDCAGTPPNDSSFTFFSPSPLFLRAAPDG